MVELFNITTPIVMALNLGTWFEFKYHNRKWDKKLRELMRTGTVENVGAYTITIDGITIWHGNYPYCSAHPHGNDERKIGFKEHVYPFQTTNRLFHYFVKEEFRKSQP